MQPNFSAYTASYRDTIIKVCRKAGLAQELLDEIDGGCSAYRTHKIIADFVDSPNSNQSADLDRVRGLMRGLEIDVLSPHSNCPKVVYLVDRGRGRC